MGVYKYDILGEVWEIDSPKSIKYQSEVSIDLKKYASSSEMPLCIWDACKNVSSWGKFIKDLKKIYGGGFNINYNIITFKVDGVAKCHPDDGWDVEWGKKLAKRRALYKLYKLISKIYMKLFRYIDDYCMHSKRATIKCLRKMYSMGINMNNDIDTQTEENNYWK